jgi:site-specific DNA-methyltransferase (adenine-specific)
MKVLKNQVVRNKGRKSKSSAKTGIAADAGNQQAGTSKDWQPKDVKLDTEIRKVIPEADPNVRAELKKKIQAEGAREPLAVSKDGLLLDGYLRHDIYEELGITDFPVKTVGISGKDQCILWRVQHNLARRHLNAYARGLLALALKPSIEAEAKQNQINGGKGRKAKKAINTKVLLAELASVSPDTMGKIAAIDTKMDATLGSGRANKIREQLLRGEKTIHNAYSELTRARKPDLTQGAVGTDGQPAKAQLKNMAYENKILHADVLEGLKLIPDGEATLIFTSPPYLGAGQTYGNVFKDDMAYDDYLDWLKSVCIEAARILRKGGRLVFNIDWMKNCVDDTSDSQPIYADLVRIMEDPEVGLILRDEFCWFKKQIAGNKMAMGSRRCPWSRRNHEYVLVWHKDDKTLPEVNGRQSDLTNEEFVEYTMSTWEINPANPKQHKHPHPFPEELAKRVIKLYCYPGDLVVDPFVGSGTVTAVAARLDRRYCGIDANAGYCEVARKRTEKEVALLSKEADTSTEAVEPVEAVELAKAGESTVVVEADAETQELRIGNQAVEQNDKAAAA